MKFSIPVFIMFSVLFSCSSNEDGPDYERRLKLAEQKVDKIMEMMDLPEYGLIKMAKEGLYTSSDFAQASEDMIKHGREMKSVDYPKKDFQDMSKEMLLAFDGLESALNSKKEANIKKSWETVKASCKKCHDVYD